MQTRSYNNKVEIRSWNHVLFKFKCKKFDQHRQKWKELDEENDIHNILQEQEMEGQRSRYFVIYLNGTELIRRI